MSYGQMAYVYDTLMSDVPYEKWLQYVNEKKATYQVDGKKLLDLACGTGTFTAHVIEEGYDVTGVDLSEDMLAVAGMKIGEIGKNIPLYAQDMTELDVLDTFDIVTIFCDSLCYLKNEEAVKATFLRVYEHLTEGGLFLFDVHSLYKMNTIFSDATFTVNEEDVALIWYTFAGEEENSVEHELTFFVLNEDEETYSRFEECHYQRTYSPEMIKNWLTEAGFTVKEVTGDFDQSINETTERVFFVAQK
ncbi:MAG: class I SAM-dependent DNA methyltransferase [Bacillaceae bacterium]